MADVMFFFLLTCVLVCGWANGLWLCAAASLMLIKVNWPTGKRSLCGVDTPNNWLGHCLSRNTSIHVRCTQIMISRIHQAGTFCRVQEQGLDYTHVYTQTFVDMQIVFVLPSTTYLVGMLIHTVYDNIALQKSDWWIIDTKCLWNNRLQLPHEK